MKYKQLFIKSLKGCKYSFLKIRNLLLFVFTVLILTFLFTKMMSYYEKMNFTISGADMFSRFYGVTPQAEKFKNQDFNFMNFLILLTPYTIFIFLISNYIHNSVLQQIYLNLLRYKSVFRWYLNHILVMLFTTVIYFSFFNFLFYFLASSITTFDLNSTYASQLLLIDLSRENIWLIITIFNILQISVIFVTLSIQYVISLFKGSLMGFGISALITGLFILSALFIKNITTPINYIIFNLKLYKGSINYISLLSFLTINILMGSFVLVIGYIFFRKKDITVSN